MFSSENRELTTPKSYVRHNEDTASQSRSHQLESGYLFYGTYKVPTFFFNFNEVGAAKLHIINLVGSVLNNIINPMCGCVPKKRCILFSTVSIKWYRTSKGSFFVGLKWNILRL